MSSYRPGSKQPSTFRTWNSPIIEHPLTAPYFPFRKKGKVKINKELPGFSTDTSQRINVEAKDFCAQRKGEWCAKLDKKCRNASRQCKTPLIKNICIDPVRTWWKHFSHFLTNVLVVKGLIFFESLTLCVHKNSGAF